jgi:hypothetical protein
LLHYLDKLVYSDISATVLTVAGLLVLRSESRAVWEADVDRPAPLVSQGSRSYPAWRNETNSHSPPSVDVHCRRM